MLAHKTDRVNKMTTSTLTLTRTQPTNQPILKLKREKIQAMDRATHPVKQNKGKSKRVQSMIRDETEITPIDMLSRKQEVL